MVSFRLSDEEYHLLQSAAEKLGAKSVSDLARSAMRKIILDSGSVQHSSMETGLEELQLKFSVLSAEVERLSRLLKDRE